VKFFRVSVMTGIKMERAMGAEPIKMQAGSGLVGCLTVF